MYIADIAYKWILACMSYFMLCFCSFGPETKGGYFHTLSNEAYKTLLLLVQGNVMAPVSERTREQRITEVRYWRQRDSLHLGPQSAPILYFDGKKVVKKSSIWSLVAKTCDQAKAGGCRKPRKRAAAGFEQKKHPTCDKQRSKVSHSQCQIHKNLELPSALYRLGQLLRLFRALQAFHELHNSVVQAKAWSIFKPQCKVIVLLSLSCVCWVQNDFVWSRD